MTETDPLCLMSLWPICSAVEVQDEGMSGVQLFITILFSILGLGVLAVIGLMVYGRWKENKRKRFYWSQNSPSAGVLHSVFVSQCQTPLKNWNTTRGREGEVNGFEAQSQENKRRHSCDIYFLLLLLWKVQLFLVEFLC